MTDSTLCQELKQPKLLDQVHQYLRLHYYSIHTERSYVEGNVAPATQNQAMNSVASAFPVACCGVSERMFKRYYSLRIEDSPQLAAESFNALVFLYKRVLRQSMEGSINAVRADKKVNVPVVMMRDEVAAVIYIKDFGNIIKPYKTPDSDP